jgi:hypothetical protein
MIRNPDNDRLLGILFTLKDGSTKFVRNMSNEKLDFDEGSYYDLLKEALHYLNMIPRKNIKSENTKDSYELASMIDKYLKTTEL